MATFTTEQRLPFTFRVVDGRGNVVPTETPTAVSSDETVGTVSGTPGEGVWNGVIDSVSPSPEGTTQRVTVTADADLGEGIQSVVGFLDYTVTLDARTGARIVEMVEGTPTDK